MNPKALFKQWMLKEMQSKSFLPVETLLKYLNDHETTPEYEEAFKKWLILNQDRFQEQPNTVQKVGELLG